MLWQGNMLLGATTCPHLFWSILLHLVGVSFLKCIFPWNHTASFSRCQQVRQSFLYPLASAFSAPDPKSCISIGKNAWACAFLIAGGWEFVMKRWYWYCQAYDKCRKWKELKILPSIDGHSVQSAQAPDRWNGEWKITFQGFCFCFALPSWKNLLFDLKDDVYKMVDREEYS